MKTKTLCNTSDYRHLCKTEEEFFILQKELTDFPWGEIIDVNRIGDFVIIQYQDHTEHNYHSFVFKNKENILSLVDTNCTSTSLYEAILVCFGYKCEGIDSKFAFYAKKLLGL